MASSSTTPLPSTSSLSNYTLRRYNEATDLPQVKQIFACNIREEWGTIYHNGKYISNAERYIKSVVDEADSDLNNLEDVYFGGGGYFWVLTYNNDDGEQHEVVGTCGLQILSPTTAEIRRMCLHENHRRLGWGSKMLQTAIEMARTTSTEKLVVSTIEHSLDGIDFYKKRNGFVDTLDEDTGLAKKVEGVHGTPISEVFMEYIM